MKDERAKQADEIDGGRRSEKNVAGDGVCFQAEDGIRDAQESRGLGDVYKRQFSRRPVVFDTLEEAQSYIREHEIAMVDLKFCDLWGRWHHVTIPAVQFTPALMAEGVGFDLSLIHI